MHESVSFTFSFIYPFVSPSCRSSLNEELIHGAFDLNICNYVTLCITDVRQGNWLETYLIVLLTRNWITGLLKSSHVLGVEN